MIKKMILQSLSFQIVFAFDFSKSRKLSWKVENNMTLSDSDFFTIFSMLTFYTCCTKICVTQIFCDTKTRDSC